MIEIDKLLAGFAGFRAERFATEAFGTLARDGQKPRLLVIACSDSRVDPAILFGAEPGELFVVRNVANLVPPFEPDGHYHGTSAAIEFAVRDLAVSHILVLGHSSCGGIAALAADGGAERDFIGSWMSLAAETCPCGGAREREQASIRRSVENLRSFPWIAAREVAGELALHGWWFDLGEGRLWRLDGEAFSPLA